MSERISEFSHLLSSLIKDKDINVYAMVQYCKIDRSTMYKYISGKRTLKDISLAKKIAEFMKLSPKEYQKYMKAYEISIVGPQAYYSRKNVEDFLLSFPNNLSPLKPAAASYTAFSLKQAERRACIPLNTSIELNNYLYWMIMEETASPNGYLGLLLQPDYEFLFHLLVSMKSENTSLKIDHIFCLSSTGEMTAEKELYNLLYLKKIMPLFFAGLDYSPHYFYDDISAHFYNLSTFPCIILTGKAVLTFSSDFKRGVVHFDPEVISFFHKDYSEKKGNCLPLFHRVNSVLEECDNLGNMGWELTSSYGFQAEPCLIPYITPTILEGMIYPYLPERETLMKRLWEFVKSSRDRLPNENMHIYHTRQGLIHFLETGRIQEIPEEIYRPFLPKERLEMLNALNQYTPLGQYHMLKGPLSDIPMNLHLCFTNYSGYILFSDHKGQNIYLIIQEASMLSAFMDYAESLDENNICSPEETDTCIRELLRQYQGKVLPPPPILAKSH